MCEMQENVVIEKQESLDECVNCIAVMYSELDRMDDENTVAQDIFEKVFRRRAKWRKRAEEAESKVKLMSEYIETQKEYHKVQLVKADEKRRDEVAKALGYRNIAEVIGLAQVDYKLVCDELYSEVEALDYVKRKNREGEYISFADALREVRRVEASANKRAMKAEERMYEAFDSEKRFKNENKKLWLAVRILGPACVGLLTFAVASIIQTLC